MNKDSVHYSSKTVEWSTPQDFFDKVAAHFKFNLDPCASIDNKKCENWYGAFDDGLSHNWTGFGDVWMNPPYGRGIGACIKKAYDTSLERTTVVCLLPARTDTKWFHDYCLKGEVEFVKGRLYFGDGPGRAPFPSMLVIFRGKR